jgi:hypothetical protein
MIERKHDDMAAGGSAPLQAKSLAKAQHFNSPRF